MNTTIMMIPCGFKIRKKADIENFVNKCMQKQNRYDIMVVNEEGNKIQYFFEKDKDGNISIDERRNGFDWFDPSIEIARSDNNCYDQTVEDVIWKLRKYINAKWFTERKEW